MFGGFQIGHLCQTISDREVGLQIEWTIPNVFQYKMQDVHFDSPQFSVNGFRWYLRIYPNGETEHDSAGWISLYLHRKTDDLGFSRSANFSFGVKKADGAVEQIGKDLSWVFTLDSAGFGRRRFLQRSVLQRRRSDLAPSDDLTVVCSLSEVGEISLRSTLSSNLCDLFLSKRGCDVTLRVQNQEFPVHKCILATRSPVFDAMLEADMKERQTGVVEIQDCDPGAFKDFLLFLYSGKFETASDRVWELHRIADKYCVLELRSACVLHLMRNLSVENFCDVAMFGHQCDDESLKEKTGLFFMENFSKIIRTAGWESFLDGNSELANDLLKRVAR